MMNSMLRSLISCRRNAHIRPAWLSVSMACVLVASCFAQSPPLGPPEITVDKFDVSAGVLTGIVQNQVKQTLDATNANLAQQNHDARVSELPIQFWSPYRLPTQYTNRPNQWYVKLPVIIGVQVHIPHWFDRQVYVPLDLNVSCEGWNMGSGVIQVDAQPGLPSFEGGSWVEDAPGFSLIKDAINSAIRSSFGVPPATQTVLALDKCIALGVLPGQGTNDKFGAILFDRPPTLPAGHHHPPINSVFGSSLQVEFVRLRRLVAHVPGDGVLYNDTENIVLQTYANYTTRATSTLTMHENDEVTLNLAPVVYKPPTLDLLVVIANINQESQGSVQDSAFAASYRSANFSPGTHTLQITKTYIVPAGPGPGHSKPQIETIPAYELTYNVAYQGTPTILTH